jgi:hypothetical protein
MSWLKYLTAAGVGAFVIYALLQAYSALLSDFLVSIFQRSELDLWIATALVGFLLALIVYAFLEDRGD